MNDTNRPKDEERVTQVPASVLDRDYQGRPVLVQLDGQYWYRTPDQEKTQRRMERRALEERYHATLNKEQFALRDELERLDGKEDEHQWREVWKAVGRFLMESGRPEVWRELYFLLYHHSNPTFRELTGVHEYREHDEVRFLHGKHWRQYLGSIDERQAAIDRGEEGDQKGGAA